MVLLGQCVDKSSHRHFLQTGNLLRGRGLVQPFHSDHANPDKKDDCVHQYPAKRVLSNNARHGLQPAQTPIPSGRSDDKSIDLATGFLQPYVNTIFENN